MKQHTFVLGMILVFYIAPTSAQEKLSLQQVISIAMQQSQEAIVITRNHAMSVAQSYEVEQRQNPEIEIDATLLENNASTGIRAELTLPYKPTQKGERQALAKAIQNVGDLEAKMRLLSLKHRVTQAYLDLWLAQEHKAFLKKNLRFAHNTQKIVVNASRRGEVGKAVSSLLKAEVLKYEDELDEYQSQEQSAQLQLFKLMNRPLVKVNVDKPLLGQLPQKIALDQYRDTRQLLEARLNAANKQAAVAKKDASFPELSPRLFYNEGFDNDSRTFGVGIRMQWPFSDSNKAELARAQAEQIHATDSLAAYDRLGYETLLDRALEQARQMQARTQTYSKEIIPAYHESFKAIQQMFKNGQASAIELWQFHERLHEAEIKKLDIYQQAFIAEMALESLMGAPLMDDALNQDIQNGE